MKDRNDMKNLHASLASSTSSNPLVYHYIHKMRKVGNVWDPVISFIYL